MERRSVEAVVDALNRSGARYLVVGGLAVVAHGYVRFTADVDIVLDLDDAAAGSALDALASLGYRPRAPVTLREFLDAGQRRRWTLEKGLTVFSLFSPDHAATEIDLFVDRPFDFDAVHARATSLELAPGVRATFIGLRDLIEMKRSAGRPQDLHDAERLEALDRPDREP
jgi:hypothetical protein